MTKRTQRFREIFSKEIESVCEERINIPGYRTALKDSLFKLLNKEKMRLDHDRSSAGINSEVRDIVNALAEFIKQ